MALPGFSLGRLVAQGGFAGEGVVPSEWQLPKFRGRTTCPTFNLNGDPRSAKEALESESIGTRYFVSKNVCHGVVYDATFHEQVDARRGNALSLEMIWHGMDAYLQRKIANSRQTALVDEAIEAAHVLLIDQDGERVGVVERDAAIDRARTTGLALVVVAAGEPPVCRLQERPLHQPAPDAEPIGKKLHDPLAACCAINPKIATWREVEIYRERGEWGARLMSGTQTRIIVQYNHNLLWRRSCKPILEAHCGRNRCFSPISGSLDFRSTFESGDDDGTPKKISRFLESL